MVMVKLRIRAVCAKLFKKGARCTRLKNWGTIGSAGEGLPARKSTLETR
jgi:hypothetical protein